MPRSLDSIVVGNREGWEHFFPDDMIFFFFLVFIRAQLLYNVLLVSAVQQSVQLYVHIYPLFLDFLSAKVTTEN